MTQRIELQGLGVKQASEHNSTAMQSQTKSVSQDIVMKS